MNVGVMKDYKLRDLRASHTLGWRNRRIKVSGSFFFFLFEMELFSIRDAGMLAKLDMAIEELAKRRDAGTISPELADKFHGMNLH
jgi:hypothetical protein